VIREIIRILAVNWAPILVCIENDGKVVADLASEAMVIVAVEAVSELSLCISYLSCSNLSSKALDILEQLYQNKGVFQEQKMLKFAKAWENTELATECYKQGEYKIHKICIIMDICVHEAKTVTTTQRMPFRVWLISAPPTSTKWLDTDWKNAKDQLEHDIHKVTPLK